MFNSISKAARPIARRVAQSTVQRAAAKATFTPGQLAAIQAVQPFSGLQARSFHASSKVERTAPVISDAEVTGLFQLWNDALATLDPDTVAKRYASKTVLLPTVSDEPRTDYDGLHDYFTNFLKNKPQGVILESNVIQGEDWCMDAGIYEFTMGASGDVVKARYSYVYTFEDGEWKIAHHHSSVMPEGPLGIPK